MPNSHYIVHSVVIMAEVSATVGPGKKKTEILFNWR